MPRKPSFSEAVLKRIADRELVEAERREQQRRFRIRLVPISLTVVLLVANSYLQFRMFRTRHKETDCAPYTVTGTVQSFAIFTTEDGIPTDLNINGEAWKIVKVKMFEDAYNRPLHDVSVGIGASTFCEKKIIAYIQAASATELRTLIWHEVFHAGACKQGGDTYWNSISPTLTKHDGVKHLGEFMANFSMANPDFMQWAARKLQ